MKFLETKRTSLLSFNISRCFKSYGVEVQRRFAGHIRGRYSSGAPILEGAVIRGFTVCLDRAIFVSLCSWRILDEGESWAKEQRRREGNGEKAI